MAESKSALLYNGTDDKPRTIMNNSIRSARYILSSSELQFIRLSEYCLCSQPM